jgi:hypothetical protein
MSIKRYEVGYSQQDSWRMGTVAPTLLESAYGVAVKYEDHVAALAAEKRYIDALMEYGISLVEMVCEGVSEYHCHIGTNVRGNDSGVIKGTTARDAVSAALKYIEDPLKGHVLYEAGDPNIPENVRVSVNEWGLTICKRCHHAESGLEKPCEGGYHDV